jgi:hypothetical protein
MRTYSDEYLNYQADRYVASGARRHGITLEQFLAYPERMLALVERFRAAEAAAPEPQDRPEPVDQVVCQRGDQLVQKLWHGSRHRGRSDSPFFTRKSH